MKKYLKYILILVCLGIAYGFYQYHKPHKNIARASVDFQISAPELYQYFDTDEEKANAQYLDKIVVVNGTVVSTEKTEEGVINVNLDSEEGMFGVICQLDNLTEHARTDFSPGERLSFKGICTGKLMDVVLVRCIVQ